MAAIAPSGRPTLNAGFATLAITLQEAAAAELSNGDVCRRLADALRDCFRGTGDWAYYIDHFGDAESGDVIYSCSGDTKRAPYSIGEVNGKTACSVQTDAAIDVMPRTVYEEEVADEDHYTAMEAAKLYTSKTEFPLYERFISKDERKTAPVGSFAGKGKSFPILKPADVMAAVRSMGRAGAENYDAGTLKRNIVKIAKAKGWEKELPKAWQGGADGKESAASGRSSGLHLVESAATLDPIVLKEARSDYEIKLIAPGKGSSAIYPAEVLKRDGPKVFKAGTHVYLNHQTAAEEAARPEGDVANLAGVLTSTAEYRETHAKGPGLYARMKVFADHATLVEEKAPHVGMSIRASGVAEASTKSGELPTLKELTSAQSVDVVTKAGAGGMILTEAAIPPATHTEEASDMDAAELKQLQESVATQTALNARLLERAIRGDAREEAVRILKGTSLHEAAKERVIESVTRDFGAIPVVDGTLDKAKFTEAVNLAAKAEGAYVATISGSGRVVGMGAAPVVEIDAKEADRKKAAGEQRLKESIQAFRDMGMPKDAAERAAKFGEVA
jgi:hypothetical protein